MRTRKKIVVGREERIPIGSTFKVGKYDYIVGRTEADGTVNYCSIERLPFASAQLRYQRGEEHLTIQKNPFLFSKQHINWFRGYLDEKDARNLTPLENKYLEEFLNVASRDGFGEDVRYLIEICSRKE